MKTCVKKNKIQLHMHDGSNMLIDKNNYNTDDVIVFDIGTRKIKDVIKMEKGSKVLVISGNNMGTVGKLEEIITTKSSMPNKVVIDTGSRKIDLPKKCVFAVGRTEPVIHIETAERDEK